MLSKQELIPKKIHAVWLGGILDEECRDNVADWKRVNPDYEVGIWIDSGLYDDTTRGEEFNKLKAWALENDVIIYDIAPANNLSTDHSPPVQNKSNIYQQMLSQQYYDDEIRGSLKHRNYAAAADILRIEVEYEEGGVYIDARDVYPAQSLGDLYAEHGFFLHEENGAINNDILGSVPHGDIITAYREEVNNRYQLLYADEEKLKAHRDQNLLSPEIYDGSNPKLVTTLRTSGPGTLEYIIGKFIKKGVLASEKDVRFDSQFYDLPMKELDLVFRSQISLEEISEMQGNVLILTGEGETRNLYIIEEGNFAGVAPVHMPLLPSHEDYDTLYQHCDLEGKVTKNKSNEALLNRAVKELTSQAGFDLKKQEASWFDPRMFRDMDKVIPVLRNYIRVQFNGEISKQIEKMSSCIEKHMKKGIFRNKKLITEMQQVNDLINLMQIRLNSLPPEVSMKSIFQYCMQDISEKEIKKINKACNGLILSLERVTSSLESFIEEGIPTYQIKSENIANALIQMSNSSWHSYKLCDFVHDVFDTVEGEPDYGVLKDYEELVQDSLLSHSTQAKL